ncbi:hypothetical protein [Streptomyces rubellomurinus]|uniref:Uncharacterized protein n=1 Tax=Streptomyces rubellomurinus (strain ATCC 31215) TaxID=359131 RepID=A0A0F2TCY9_STRR3|nr:hypothetical protein [Streptomyces rubellomurinus]KJS61009.1 hypothetical protein VM95_17860 [Streptomyces rubellomurinus]
MEIVHASLKRRHPASAARENEAAEAVDALWAHAEPADGLQHASALPAPDRLDLLLYLLTQDTPGQGDAVSRAHRLITRSHRTSPLLRHSYLPLDPRAATGRTAR